MTLSDPAVPGSVQPYHAALVQHRLQNLRAAATFVASVERVAGQAVDKLLDEYEVLGFRPRAAALVVGSLIDPATIANQHMRAHALEGQLFRTVVERALQRAGLTVDRHSPTERLRARGDDAGRIDRRAEARRQDPRRVS